jgi:hypothetical protein
MYTRQSREIHPAREEIHSAKEEINGNRRQQYLTLKGHRCNFKQTKMKVQHKLGPNQ